jgi:hypothetical protein
MTFILRWPSILVLLALVLLSFLGALAAAGAITGFETGIAQIEVAQAEAAEAGAGQATWVDVGLWTGAGLFFLISAIRLMRRTQGFWTWLLGFACYGGRWAWAQQSDGGLAETIRGIDVNAYRQPQAMVADLSTAEAQLGVLAIVLIVGLLILIIDAADRAHWDKQGA